VAHLAVVLTADATIRQGLRAGDIGAVTRMHGLLYQREHGLDHRIEASVAEGMVRYADAMHAGSGAALWVAERECEVVGAIGITEEGNGVARVRWFIVVPDARRTGIGTGLLDGAVGWARERDVRRVVLFTIGVLVDAARLYRRAGFRKVSERVGTEWSETLVEERWELDLRA
jgi:GNAT superfamily N-acetyltransferase